jgi:hypothetical protein
MIGGICIDEARVNKEFAAINQSGFYALPKYMLKESLKGIYSPSDPGFAKYTMIWYLIIKVIAKKPQPIEAFWDSEHKFPFRANIIEH